MYRACSSFCHLLFASGNNYKCEYLHMFEWNHMLPLKSERLSCFWQCPTPGLIFFGKCPTVGKKKWKNTRQMPGGWARLELIEPLKWPILFNMCTPLVSDWEIREGAKSSNVISEGGRGHSLIDKYLYGKGERVIR